MKFISINTILFLTIAACGGQNNAHGPAPVASPGPTGEPTVQPTPDLHGGQEGGWYAMVTKCLVDVAEKREGGTSFLEQTIDCSDVFSAESYAEVVEMARVWGREHCPEMLTIRNLAVTPGVPNSWGGSHFRAHGPQNVVANARQEVESKRQSAGVCAGGRAFNYGNVSP